MQNKRLISKVTASCCGCLLFLFFSGCSTISNWFSPVEESQQIKVSEALTEDNLKQFSSSIRTVEGNAVNHYNLARNFQKKGRHKIAIEECIKSLKIDSEYYKAYNAMGVSYDYLKDYEQAEYAYKKALSIRSDLDYVYNNMGYSYLLSGNLVEALKSFEKAVALNEDKAVYKNNLLLTRTRLGLQNETIATAPTSVKEIKKIQEIPDRRSSLNAEVKPSPVVKPIDKQKRHEEVSETFFSIQIGAYYSLDKAVNALNKARKMGYDCPYITRIERNKTYYRVRLGKYKIFEKAEAVALQILDERGRKSFVTTETYPLAVFHAVEKNTCENMIVKNSEFKGNDLKIEVFNGNGVNLMAKRMSLFFKNRGFSVIRPSNAKHFKFEKTQIFYSPGNYQGAVKLARSLPGVDIETQCIESDSLRTDLRVRIGKDIIAFNSDLKKKLNI